MILTKDLLYPSVVNPANREKEINTLIDYHKNRGYDYAGARTQAEDDYKWKQRVNHEIEDNPFHYMKLYEALTKKWDQVKTDHGLNFDSSKQAIATVRLYASAKVRVIAAEKNRLIKELKDQHPSWNQEDIEAEAARKVSMLSNEEIDQRTNDKLQEWAERELTDIERNAKGLAKDHLDANKVIEPIEEGYTGLTSTALLNLRLAPVLKTTKSKTSKAVSDFFLNYAKGIADALEKQGKRDIANQHLQAAEGASKNILDRDPSNNVHNPLQPTRTGYPPFTPFAPEKTDPTRTL